MSVPSDQPPAGASPIPPVSQDGVAPTLTGPQSNHQPEIKGYQLISPLGHGGMGAVYRAVQLSTHRPVAIKVLAGGTFNSPKARFRFEREVELAARLDHPNIAKVYDSGLHYGAYYYAMELVDGQHLDQYIQAQTSTHRQILEMLGTIARAVQHAHQRGVIHRDLKPSNILVTGQGHPIILDFGLAKQIESDSDILNVTVDGHMAGTLAYASPQQIMGQSGIDTRTDVYSLGVILYQLLTGQLPHEMSGAPHEIQRRIVEQDVRRPRMANPLIDRELESLLLKSLAKNPNDRYADAGALADDLHRYLNHQPLTAHPLTRRYLLRKWLWRNRRDATIAAALAAVLLGLATFSYVSIRAERDRAEYHADEAIHSLYLTRITLAKSQLEAKNAADAQATLDSCPEDLRRWEWYRLRYLADQSRWVIPAKNVQSLALMAQGDRLVTLGNDIPITVYDVQTSKMIRQFHDFVPTKQDAKWIHPQGVCVGLASPDGLLRILQVETGQVTYHAIPSGKWRLAIANDVQASWLVLQGKSSIQVARLTKNLSWMEIPESDEASAFAIHDNGLLAWTKQNQLHLWDTSAAKERWTTSLPTPWVNLVFCGNGTSLWGADRSGKYHQYDLTAGQPLKTIQTPNNNHAPSAISGDGSLLAVAQNDGSISLWNTPDQTSSPVLLGHTFKAFSLASSLDGKVLASLSRDGTIRVWETESAEGILVSDTWFRANQYHVIDVSRGTQGLSGILRDTGQPFFWPTGSQTPAVIDTAGKMLRRVAFSPDGTKMVGITDTEQLVRWNARHRRQNDEMAHHHLPALYASLSSDGKQIAVTYEAKEPQLVVWDGESGKPLATLPSHSPSWFSPDGRWLVTEDKTHSALILWSTKTWEEVHRYINIQTVQKIAFSADSTQIAVADQSGHLWTIDLMKKSIRQLPSKQNPAVTGLAFNPAADRLLIVGKGIWLWDTSSGVELLQLSSKDDEQCAWFDDQGKTIQSINTDGVLTRWNTSFATNPATTKPPGP